MRQKNTGVLGYDVTEEFELDSAGRSFTDLYVHEDSWSLHTC